MRFFEWVDFQYEMLALFMGLIALILVYIAWASYPQRRVARTPDELDERRGHELQTAHDTQKNPIAPFLIFVYIGVATWSFFYMIFAWARASKF